ncbi:ABC transporter permease [Desulfuribacillus alkaliarsenatis]|uniref:ABC transporter permease n=1 Tax=Desulfuribacillus alkaliarsenatis TaxID=766136 RepID=A0A1E5G306_9FIRM|nr:ABC transporter permease subunit [Desulfuribacillus alkaliarsenatis]OEF97456.1 ABC transporter permease [Desulfuribacillus alkaliarsenatis]
MKDFTLISKQSLNAIIYKLLILAFWVMVWQFGYMMIQKDIYLPSPVAVFTKLQELVLLKSFWISTAYTMYRVAVGLFLSMIIGLMLGVLASLNRFIYDLLHPLVVTIKSTPVMSFIIIALIWFTSSNVPIFICFLMCFPIIYTNVVEGVRNTDIKLVEMARVHHVKISTILKEIYLPTLKPYFLAAAVTSLGLGWKVTVAAEVLSHPRLAVGSNLYSAKVYLDSAELFAWTIVVVILSLVFERIFTWVVKRQETKGGANCE